MSAPAIPALRPLQQLFWRPLTAPECVASGAAALRREGLLESDDLSFLVRADERLGATERLDVYADMYFYRLRDGLAEDFPKLAAWLGDAPFHNLVTDYLLAHPSTHFSLRELGRALPGFLASHALARSHAAAPDLARLEWARVDVFDEADVALLDRDALLARGAADPEGFARRVGPAARRLRLRAAALARWRDPAADPGDAAAAPVDALVWRRGFAVHHRSLPADEADGLDALAEGATLADVGERLARALPAETPPERASARLAELLELWTRDALLTEAS